MIRYPDKPPGATDGSDFETLGESLHWRFFGEKIEVFKDQWSQFNIGESRAGVEFKELRNSHTRLHIEIAEKTRVDRPWVPSGIMRADNTQRYVCGNNRDIFAFAKETLRAYYYEADALEVWFGRDANTGNFRLGDVGDSALAATIHSFVLDKSIADEICLYRFLRQPDDWHVMPCAAARLLDTSAPPLVPESSQPEDWAWWEWANDQIARVASPPLVPSMTAREAIRAGKQFEYITGIIEASDA